MSEKDKEKEDPAAQGDWIAKQLEAIRQHRRTEKRPPLLPKLVVHRLGTYHGDRS